MQILVAASARMGTVEDSKRNKLPCEQQLDMR